MKRILKPAKTESVKKLLTIWKRIDAGKLANDLLRREPLDPIETGKTHELFLKVLRINAGQGRISGDTRKEVDASLAVWKRIYGHGSSAPRGVGNTFSQKGESRDWNLIYRAQLINDLLEPYNETLTGHKYPCIIDYYLGVCPRCGKIFERDTSLQKWCGNSCRGSQNKPIKK